jgi:glycerol transport system ATP-binding protein
MARLLLEGVAHSYRPRPSDDPADWALKPLDFAFEQGGAYALLGPSGCGKTSLLNILSGLVAPSRGRVLFDGVDVTQKPTEARNIAQVFQFPVVYDTMTVGENLAFPLKNRGVPAAQITARVREIADLLDLSRDLDAKARGLTADAKQKISLGRGLVRADVAAVLFDEPLTVIDPRLKWELRSKLKALHRALDLTMIYVTHDQTEALTFADQVVVMLDGRVVQAGTPQALFEQPQHTFVGHFIGSPGMNLIPVTVAGDRALTRAGSLALGATYDNLSDNIELGIRPEHLRLCAAGQGRDELPVAIQRIDDLGRLRIAHVDLAGTSLAVMAGDFDAAAGASAAIAFDMSRAGIFADGRRVAPLSGARSQPGGVAHG